MVNNFESIISAKAVGTQDVNAQAEAIRKLSDSIDGLAAKTKKVNEQSNFDNFASKVKAGISDPLGTAGSMAESFLAKMGPVGAGVAGLATAFTAIGAAGLSFARDLGHLSDEIEDTSVRMGLTIKETQEFRFAMKYAGGEMGTLEGIMKKLSAEIEDGGANLKSMGVEFRDATTGGVRPMSEIVLQLSDRLGKIPDVAHRNAEAIKVLGKSALAVLPDLLGFGDGVKRASEIGIAKTEEQIRLYAKYHQQVVEINEQIQKLTDDLKQPIAGTVLLTLKVGGAAWSLFGGTSQALGNAMFGGTGSQPADMDMSSPSAGSLAAERRSLDYNNALVAAARSGGNSDQLSQAKQKLSDLRKGLKDDVLPSVNQEALAAVAAQVSVVAGIEARIAANKKLADSIDDVIRGINAQTSADAKLRQDASAKIFAGQVDILSRDNAVRTPQQAMEEFMFQRGMGRLATFRNRGNSGDDLAAEFAAFNRQRIQDSELSFSLSSMRDSFDISSAQSRGAGPNAIYALRIQQIDRELTAQKELARLKNSQMDMDRALADHTEKRYQASIERENELLQIGLRQKNEFQDLAVGGLNAAVTGNGRNFLKYSGANLVNQVAGNAAGMVWSEVSKIIPRSGSKLFEGTLFADPMKRSTDANTIATIENTHALSALNFRGGSGGGGYSSADSTFARIYGGGVGSPSSAYNDPLMATAGYGVEEFDAAGNGVYAAGRQAAGGGFNFTKAIGYGGAVAGGGLGIYAGARQGGIRGGLNAGGAGAGATSAILMAASAGGPFLAPILMGVGLALPFISSLFPDPKKEYAERQAREAQSRSFTMPTGADYAVDTYGRSLSYDSRGGLRPIVIYQTNHVQAVDGPSLERHLVENPTALAKGITSMVQGGNGDDALAVFNRS